MDDRKRDLWFALFKEKQKLQEHIVRLERSIPAYVVPPFPIGKGPIDKAREDMVRKKKEIKRIDERLAQLERADNQVKKRKSPGADRKPQAIVWLGTNREFGETILSLHRAEKIKARSDTDALKQATKHFVNKDGKTFDPRSTLQNVKNKLDYKKLNN